MTRPTAESPPSGNSSTSTLTIAPSKSSTLLNSRGSDAHAIDRAAIRRQFHSFRDGNPLLDPVVGRNNKVAAFADAKLAHDSDMGAPEDTDQFPFRSAFRAPPCDMHQSAIAVHTFRCFVRRQKDVLRRGTADRIGDQKAEAIPMNRQAAGQVVRVCSRHDKMTGAEFDQKSFFRQPVERVFERIPILAGEP